MKYVFPEAIKIERVLIHDERTLCMRPDLKISILFDIVGHPSYPGQSISMALGHAFRVRLLEYFNVNHVRALFSISELLFNFLKHEIFY